MEENNSPPLPPTLPATPSSQPATTAPQIPSTSTICNSCGAVVPANYTFCPNCGKPLEEKKLSTSLFTQISLYVVAILLPPLGYWPGVKYFRNPDSKAQKLGMYLIAVTTLSTIITLWLTFAFVQSYIGDINNALNGTGITPSQATGGLL